jgi:hypothetical protein
VLSILLSDSNYRSNLKHKKKMAPRKEPSFFYVQLPQ